MMGQRDIKLSGGDEWDAFHRYSRGILYWKPGEIKKIKRRHNKRVRTNMKKLILLDDYTEYNDDISAIGWSVKHKLIPPNPENDREIGLIPTSQIKVPENTAKQK